MFRSRKLSYSYPSTTGQFNADYANLPLKKCILNIPITQTGSGTPSPTNIRDFVGVDTVRINMVNFNQFVQNGNFAGGITDWEANRASLTATDNILTSTCTTNGYVSIISSNFEDKKDKVLLIALKVKISPLTGSFNVAVHGSTIGTNATSFPSSLFIPDTWCDLVFIYKPTADNATKIRFGMNNQTLGDTIELQDVQVFDLTQMFGANIADSLYNMEQQTQGAGVALFKKIFYKDYYAYNVGGSWVSVASVNGDSYPDYAEVQIGQTVYSAYLDVLTGKLSVTHVRKAMSDLEWTIVTDAESEFGYDYFRSSGNIEDMKSIIGMSCDCLKSVSSSRQSLNNNEIGRYNSSTFSRRLVARADSITTIEDWNTFIADKYIVYELAEPIEIPLGGIDIKTLQGTNNIFADVGALDIQYCDIS